MSALILSSPINATTINTSKIAPAISHLRMECPRLRSRFHVNQIDVSKFNGWPTVTQLRIQNSAPYPFDCIKRYSRENVAPMLTSTDSAALAALHRLGGGNGALFGFDQMKSWRWHTDMNVRTRRYARHLTAKSKKRNPRLAQICDQASALTALRRHGHIDSFTVVIA